MLDLLLPKEVLERVDNFEFVVGETWLSSLHVPFMTVLIYLLTLKLIKVYVNQRKEPFDLRRVSLNRK